MSNSFFYLQAEKNHKSQRLIECLQQWSLDNAVQTYVISSPLVESKYSYAHSDALVVLATGRKIAFIDFSGDSDSFASFADDFIEDLGSISDKYMYKEAIGRPRDWRRDLTWRCEDGAALTLEEWQRQTDVADPGRRRIGELLISLLTGSINDIERVKAALPENLLDKVKRKILLFDGDQTRFIYERPASSPIRIQGLSGTGKTELLLHKLKELYVTFPEARIALTCHSEILAGTLRQRIPVFFNSMKVDEQIRWQERLWCIRAWGSQVSPNSGVYSYICHYYGLTFQRYNNQMPFAKACSLALAELKTKKSDRSAFEFMLIDEGQDFSQEFFDLCSAATEKTVYIAGDVFQNIFDHDIGASVEPNFLLNKCYRTDPRTLMFAHGVGMGLFEAKKLRWLKDDQWRACGYILEDHPHTGAYRLRREPLRRFEDIESEKLPSVILKLIPGEFYASAAAVITSTIKNLAHEHPTLCPDDVGVILLDGSRLVYRLADELELIIRRETGWRVNKAYESKRRPTGQLFLSNRNNVKGLEFPFVICVTNQVGRSRSYRSALYMALTRSFIQTFLVASESPLDDSLDAIKCGLETINTKGYMEVLPPPAREQELINTEISYSDSPESLFDCADEIFDDIGIDPSRRALLLESLKPIFTDAFDRESVRETAEFLYKKMQGSETSEAA